MTDLPSAGISLRPADAADMAACAETWRAGLDDYGIRVGRPPVAAVPGSLLPLLEHLRGTDPGGFRVAVRPEPGGAERVVGFTSALRREQVWFLAMLFVHPVEQGRGLGRALLASVLPATSEPAAGDSGDPDAGELTSGESASGGDPPCLATCTDAAQPISNALYARLGIVPRMPVLELVGRPDPRRLAPLPGDVRAVPFEAFGGSGAAAGSSHLAGALAVLDRGTLGYAHPEDHAFVAASGRLGYLYVTGDGRAVGYGYTSVVGRVGPVAAEDEGLMPAILGHLLGAIEPTGAHSTWVPGAAGRAVTALLEAGLRIEDFPALLCWNRPFGDFSRYVPITLAVL